MIKGKSPYPFERIALAVAFSPRLEGLIAEVRRLQQLHKAEVIFIHVGKKTSEKQRQLSAYLNKYGFSDSNSRIFWEQGTPSEVIPGLCKSEIVDLIVLGALQRNDVLAGYMSTLSGEISRKAKCAVLLLTAPSPDARTFQRVAVNGHAHRKTPFTLGTVSYLAELHGSSELLVFSVDDVEVLSSVETDAWAETARGVVAQTSLSARQYGRQVVETLCRPGLQVSHHSLSGKSGNAIRDFAREYAVDLLVVNSPDHTLSIFDRIIPHDIESLLSDIPCNLLIVHSRFSGADSLTID
ncbi:MAG: hypothetical protein RL021_330 [Bacteroidota bacterium]|jgi:nucleotide-binding universal stress UspA family protein